MARKDENVTIRDTEFIFRTNFRGAVSEYNKNGAKEFNIVLDKDTENILSKAGWNVKHTEPKEEGDKPIAFLPVRVNFDSYYPPRVWLVNADTGARTMLDDETIGQLDYLSRDEIRKVNIVVNPSHYDNRVGKGIKAYCRSMMVYFTPDPFEAEYQEEFGGKFPRPDDVKDDAEDDIPF